MSTELTKRLQELASSDEITPQFTGLEQGTVGLFLDLPEVFEQIT
jgi:hypothetical protein